MDRIASHLSLLVTIVSNLNRHLVPHVLSYWITTSLWLSGFGIEIRHGEMWTRDSHEGTKYPCKKRKMLVYFWQSCKSIRTAAAEYVIQHCPSQKDQATERTNRIPSGLPFFWCLSRWKMLSRPYTREGHGSVMENKLVGQKVRNLIPSSSS